MTAILYTHRQFNRLFFLLLFFGATAATVAVILDHRPWVVIPILGALALTVLLFSSLSIEVSNTHLRFWYGVGLLHWNVPLSDISTVARSRSHWYEGWGIRLSFRGWLYNIAGFDCIEVRRSSGSTFRLGTDDPQRLLSALQQALAKSGH